MVNFVKFSKRKVLVFGQRDLKSSCFIMGLRLHLKFDVKKKKNSNLIFLKNLTPGKRWSTYA